MVFQKTRSVEVWDLETRNLLGQTEQLAYVVKAFALSADGRIAVAGSGSTLTVWDLERVIGLQSAPAEEVTSLALADVTPQILAVIATYQTLSGWDVRTGQQLWRHTDGGALDLAAVPGQLAVVVARSDGNVTLLNPLSGDESRFDAKPGRSPGRAVAVDADGRLAATADFKAISIWDIHSRRRIHRIVTKHHAVKALAITPHPAILVSLADRGAYAGERNLKCWDLETGAELASSRERLRWLDRLRRGRDQRSSQSQPYQTRPLAITSDGAFAVSALFSEGLRAWNLRGAAVEPRLLLGDTQEEAVVVLSGRLAIAPEGYSGSRLVLWDVGAGEPVGYFEGTGGKANTLAVSRDGRRLLSAGNHLTVSLWDIETRRVLARFTLEDFPRVCALSQRGEFAVVGDRRAIHFLKFEVEAGGVQRFEIL
jgi:WD40 repeat protein